MKRGLVYGLLVVLCTPMHGAQAGFDHHAWEWETVHVGVSAQGMAGSGRGRRTLLQQHLRGLEEQPLVEDSASDLEAELDGALLRAGTGGVDPAAFLWNGLQHGPSPYIPPAQPGWVVLANSTRDASLAAQFALDSRVKLYARGKGHHYAGVCLANGGMTVDLSRLTGVQIDVLALVARVEAGAAAGQVIYPANAEGLWAPVANIDGVGMAGFLLAGGQSERMIQYGLGSDNILAFEVVDIWSGNASGSIVTVDKDSHPDLFWALRGAGQNVGLVTAFHLKLQPAAANVTIISGTVPLAQGPQAIQWLLGAAPSAPNTVSMTVSFGANRTTGVVRASMSATSYYSPSTDPAFVPVLQQAFDVAQQLGGAASNRTLPAIGTRIPGLPPGYTTYTLDAWLSEVNQEVIDIITDLASTLPTNRSSVALSRSTTADQNPGGVDGPIGARGKFTLGVWAVWQRTPGGATVDGDAQNIAWVRQARARLQPYIVQIYCNTANFDVPGDTQLCYDPAAWVRVVAAKLRYDPKNLLRELDYYKKDEGRSAVDASPNADVKARR